VTTHEAWSLVPNPAWAGKQPGDGVLEPDCHDRSHFLTLECECGSTMHVHETQLGKPTSGIMAACKGCDEILMFEPGVLHGAFAEMRKQGWIK
jgi:hypothetical protein